MRRYVDAFVQHASPHLPVTHTPTLSFETITFPPASLSPPSYGLSGMADGKGCLVLGMAAIGALYEHDHATSKELFEAAKRMISLYLEERRKADTAASHAPGHPGAGETETPLWLVQAMLLNVIYGHQCGDKMSADIASTHCAALVSLARAAGLTRPAPSESSQTGEDVEMHDEGELHTQWLIWRTAEERKRTLFAIFMLSSLLTSAFNQTPTITNSEILLDLPCDEELYQAGSAQEWQNRGGKAAADATAISFAGALSTLLTAGQRRDDLFAAPAHPTHNPLSSLQAGHGNVHNHGLRPSTFGCLVLINAIHNYIWETRSRHHGVHWTAQETEAMFSHIEPALTAWQAAWKANEHHKLERPNPFGRGPLSADCIPLLDLAFVRLFVNLSRAKEAFWRRDFDAMSEILAEARKSFSMRKPHPPLLTCPTPIPSPPWPRTAAHPVPTPPPPASPSPNAAAPLRSLSLPPSAPAPAPAPPTRRRPNASATCEKPLSTLPTR